MHNAKREAYAIMQISLRVTDAEFRSLVETAEREGLKWEDFVRMVFEKGLASFRVSNSV